jgi:hypothetical protein
MKYYRRKLNFLFREKVWNARLEHGCKSGLWLWVENETNTPFWSLGYEEDYKICEKCFKLVEEENENIIKNKYKFSKNCIPSAMGRADQNCK